MKETSKSDPMAVSMLQSAIGDILMLVTDCDPLVVPLITKKHNPPKSITDMALAPTIVMSP